nr:hypothetical protein [Tanacetum cinerariifolium]
MATTIEQQVVLDEALLPSTQRLRIGRSNFQLPSDIQSKESTLQVIYDVLRRCPFFKAFLVTADVLEIYMQSFWATAYVHQHSIRFKMDNKKHIVNLESFRDMLHICPRIPGQSFDELPFEEEIMDFLRFLKHSAQIRTLTDVNINKLFQPRRPFTVVINKCLTEKNSGFDSFRDDFMFSTVKVVSRHQNTQQYDAILPIELTNEEIRNTNAYKEYYAYATGEAAPKPKSSARRKRSDSDTSITPPTATLTSKPTAATPKLTAAAKAKQPAKASNLKMHISQPGGSGIDEGTDADAQEKDGEDDEGDEKDKSDAREEDDDNDKYGDERDDDDDDDQEIAKIDEQDDTKRGGDDDKESKSDDEEIREDESFDPIPRTPKDSEDDGNDKEDQGLNDGEEESLNEEEEADELYRDVDINQGRGIQLSQDIKDSHVTLTPINPDGQQESSSVQTNLFGEAVSAISGIVDQYMNQQMNEAFVNAQLEAEVLTRSSHSSRTSYAVAADLSEMELKKILIEKMEGNKSPAGSDRGSKRRREGKEHESASIPLETATRSAGRSTTGFKSRQASTSESAFAEEPVQTTSQIKELSHPVFETDFSNFIMNRLRVDTLTPKLLARPTYELMKGSCTSLIELEYHLEEVYKATTDQLDWVNPEGQKYLHNLLQPLPLIPDNRGRRVIPFAHFINNDLEYLRGGASSRKYTTSITKTKAADYGNIKWIEDLVPRTMWIQEPIYYDKHALWEVSHWGRKHQQFYSFAVNRKSALDIYSKRRIIAVTDLKIVEWHSYKHLDWISVRRDDDKIYKFKEGDFKRLRLQDIEDMLLLLVQGKLSNLTVEERFAFNVSFRMFTKSVVIQRCVKDLQLGVESYQKRLNLTKPDTYRSALKRMEAYTAYSNP